MFAIDATDEARPNFKRVQKRCAANAALMENMRMVVAQIRDRARARTSQPPAPEPPSLEPAAPAPDPVPPGYTKLYAEQEFREAKAWAESLPRESKTAVLRHLKALGDVGPMRRICVAPEVECLDALASNFPNFKQVTDFVRRRFLLSNLSPDKVCKLPPLLLAGSPGVGKTAYARRLAHLLNVPMKIIDASTISSPFEMSGLDVGYGGGKPGIVWQSLAGSSSASICFVLDEIDKIKEPEHSSFLYSLLEPSSASRYTDAAIRLPMDASFVTWVATCNYLEKVEPALKSRFRILHIDPPDANQIPSIVASIHAELLAGEPWGVAFDKKLDGAVVARLVDRSPRQIKQALEDAYANAAEAGRRHVIAADIEPIQAASLGRRIGFL